MKTSLTNSTQSFCINHICNRENLFVTPLYFLKKMGLLIERPILLNKYLVRSASLEVEAGIKCIPPNNKRLRNLPRVLGCWAVGWKKIPSGRSREYSGKKRHIAGNFQVNCYSLHDVHHVSPSVNSALFPNTLVGEGINGQEVEQRMREKLTSGLLDQEK